MSKLPTTRTKKGFTLIELMIVVAIVALLIAILLPSLARARQQAMQVACAANLKSIGIGMFYCTEDRLNGNGYLPQLTYTIESWGFYGYWTDQISKYVKIKRTRAGSRTGLTVCPAQEEPQLRHVTGYLAGVEATLAEKIRCDTGLGTGTRRRGGASASFRDCHIEPVSYTGSCDILTGALWSGYPIRKLSSIDRPHCFLLMTEVNQRSARAALCFRMTDLILEASAPGRIGQDYRRHYGGAKPATNGSNFLFADTHVQWWSAAYASSPKLVCCIDPGPWEPGISPLNTARELQKTMCEDVKGETRRR